MDGILYVFQDTRTHIVQEIFRNEQSYVESLQTVICKYLKVLKLPEHAGMIEVRTVDEIFFMVPDILEIHEKFLAELRNRLDNWDTQQRVGDAFMETVTIQVDPCSRFKLKIPFNFISIHLVFQIGSLGSLYIVCK